MSPMGCPAEKKTQPVDQHKMSGAGRCSNRRMSRVSSSVEVLIGNMLFYHSQSLNPSPLFSIDYHKVSNAGATGMACLEQLATHYARSIGNWDSPVLLSNSNSFRRTDWVNLEVPCNAECGKE